jgi:hypothetical protein
MQRRALFDERLLHIATAADMPNISTNTCPNAYADELTTDARPDPCADDRVANTGAFPSPDSTTNPHADERTTDAGAFPSSDYSTTNPHADERATDAGAFPSTDYSSAKPRSHPGADTKADPGF